jgi:iron complex transport system substrate-binding protein
MATIATPSAPTSGPVGDAQLAAEADSTFPPQTCRPRLRPHRPRAARLLALLAALAVVAGACGSDGDGGQDDADAGASGDGAAGGDAFPVEIEHKFGSTTIEEAPERIVTVGLTDQDAVLALGVVPVGITDWFGDHPHAVWPWAQDLLGGAEPEVLDGEEGPDLEAIAALRPDVIVGLYAGLTEEQYDLLSQIAPTVAQPGDHVDWGIPWQEQTATVGRVLGKADEAEALVQDVEDRFAQVRADHPEFEGAIGVVATPYQGTISVYAPEDPRGRFLADLGFVPFEGLEDLAGDQFASELSMEQIELLDVDALVWILGHDVEADLARLHEEPLYAGLSVVREGREVGVSNYDTLGGATSFQTVLSVPVLLDGLVPMLAAAVDGDPATVVEQPA